MGELLKICKVIFQI